MKTKRLLLIVICLSVSLCFVQPLHAADPVTIAPSGDQSGQTDADALQAALSDAEPGAVIQLEEGTYYLNHVLLAENFRGTIQGAGREKTTITTVGELPVSPDVPVWKNPPSLENPWPFVLTIVDGDVTVQAMTWRISERIPLRFKYVGDFEIPAMPAIIGIFSSKEGEAGQSLLQDIRLEGAEGEFSGLNLIQIVYHEGLIGWQAGADGKVTYSGYPLRGQHRVTNAYYAHAFAGNSVLNMADETTLTIEESIFVDVVEGVEVLDTGGTIIVANNVITTAGGDGVGVIAMQGYFTVPEDSTAPPAPPAIVKITDNQIYVDGGHAAVDLADMQYAILGAPAGLDVTVEGNQIVLNKANYGIIGYGLTDFQLRNNTISGSALYDGIHVSFASNDVVTLQPGDKAQLGAYGRDVLRRAPQPPAVAPLIEVTPTMGISPAEATTTSTIAWPGARVYHQMAYDAESKQVIVLGGQIAVMESLTDTWAYDPMAGTWQEMMPSDVPPSSEGPMAYDEKVDRIIYFAALDGQTFGPLSETWVYDDNGDTWTKLTTTQSPTPGMVGARMVYDSESERMILFGGYDIPNNGYFSETWVFDSAANSWTKMEPAVSPPGTNFQSMVYDSQEDRVIMWGSVSDDRMWSYDTNTNTWSEVADTGTPPLMDYTRMVYVPELQQSILFGGVDVPGEVPQGDTWLYDHATQKWQKLSLTNSPEPRGWHDMLFEPISKRILLFGGGTGRGSPYSDLWSFDPVDQSWTEIIP